MIFFFVCLFGVFLLPTLSSPKHICYALLHVAILLIYVYIMLPCILSIVLKGIYQLQFVIFPVNTSVSIAITQVDLIFAHVAWEVFCEV